MGFETLIPIGMSLLGSSMQADATEDAANAQAGATRDSIAEQRRQYDLTRSDYAPWREAGKNALQQLTESMRMPVTSADVMSDPGYAFGQQQGQLALDRKAAAAGGRVSGAALKSASRFATDYATTGYNSAYQRRQDSLNRLASIAGLGQTATAGSAAAGTSAANAISGALQSQGDATGAARLAQGSIWGNAATRLGSSAFGAPVYNAGGYSGTNDRNIFSTGNNVDWWSTYGSGGD